MNNDDHKLDVNPDLRPWFREPWVWVLIAFPLAAVVGCVVTIWLALSHPDYLVVDEQKYDEIKAELGAVHKADSPAQGGAGAESSSGNSEMNSSGTSQEYGDG